MDYEQFKTKMEELLNLCLQYRPDQIGSGHYIKKMVDLAEAYPDHDLKLEQEKAS